MCPRCQSDKDDLIANSIVCINSSCTEPLLITEGSTECSVCGKIPEKSRIDRALSVMEKCKSTKEEREHLQKTNEFQLLLKISESSLQEADSLLHLLNIHYVRVLDNAFEASINLGNWEKACEYGRSTMDGFKYYYGSCHPVIGLQLLKLAKIELHEEQYANAEKHLLQAGAVIGVTQSRSSLAYRTCLELLSQCKMQGKL